MTPANRGKVADHQRDRVTQAYRGENVDAATKSLTRNRIHWILDQLPSGHVADLGCSEGIVSMLLGERGDRADGYDIDRDALEFAERERASRPGDQRERIRFQYADVVDIPTPEGNYDAAVLAEVLEHVDDPGAVVQEAHRVLKPGGTIVVTVPFGVMPHHDHHRVFYFDTMQRLLEPLFDTHSIELLEKHIGYVGRKRESTAVPEFRLDSQEAAFKRWEEHYRERLDALAESLQKRE